MISFKDFLIEAERSQGRIHKLINYIADKHGKDPNEIPFRREYSHSSGPTPLHPADKHMFDYVGTQTMKMSDLHPGQQFFSAAGLHHYNDKYNYNYRNPIVAVHYPKENITVIHDGHHRWLSNRLKRVSHDNVKLFRVNDKWKDGSDD